MIYRSIIFDLDGTLIDSAELTGQIIDEMLAERGAEKAADRNLIKAMDAVGGIPMIEAVMAGFTADPAADLEEFRARHRSIPTPPTLAFPGVRDTLGMLRDIGVSMAICSNKPQFLCEKILGDLGLDIHFDAVLGSMPQRPRKPDPVIANLALNALGANHRETLFCGDSIVDADTAKAAGLEICLVKWGYGTPHALGMDPDLPLVIKMADLIDLVHGRTGLNPLPAITDPRGQ
ncbi:MAG: HAD family hydrolase [Porphyrobacter sp. IPPAS B-1204]|nr:MAG: HAD family hydrolase [Porphyrobacter sp. IPPAS B-1204]